MSGLPDKELKMMVIKIPTKFRRTMHKQSENSNKEKKNILKAPSRSHGAEEYNHRTEKHNKGVQQQTR